MIATIVYALPILKIVILAAGFSRRLGQPKPLAKIRGRSLLDRTLEILAPLAAGLPIIVVIPPRSARYRIGLHTAAAIFVVNHERASGLSSSVRLGLLRAHYSAAVLLLPVDLGDLRRRDIEKLILQWRGRRRSVVARALGARAATPLILPRSLYAAAAHGTGDQGLREFVRGLPRERLKLVHLPSAEADIDTADDLQAARRRLRTSTPTR